MASSQTTVTALAILALCAAATLDRAVAQDATPVVSANTPVGKWRVAVPMSERREYGGGVRLLNGKILAVSGHPLQGKSIASAELYDPQTGTWSNTGSLDQARNGGNTATLLLDGRVLIAGGHSNAAVVRGAEIYDPATGNWTDAGTLSVGRDPAATRLADGRVLLSGGIDWYTDSGKIYDLSELFDPVSGKWTATGPLLTARDQHRTALLDDGRVLAVGGYAMGSVLLASAEVYNPATGLWNATGKLPTPRSWFSLIKLLDGRVLVAGGYTGGASKRTYLASAALYNPKNGQWSDTRPMKDKRGGFSMTLLPDGQVLVAGGVAESGWELKTAELFDPRSETWRVAAPLNVARRNHRTALLPDGSVLVLGGSSFHGNKYLESCEIFSEY